MKFLQSILDHIQGVFSYSLSSEDYCLHKAVFERNLLLIRKLCAGEDLRYIYVDIDKPDPLGNTPLMLATKLELFEEAIVLIDHGADPKFRPTPEAQTPLEQALGMKNAAFLRLMFLGQQRCLERLWDENAQEMSDSIQRMPDFTMKMKWECDSRYIPFVKKFTPSDEYVIYKTGKSIRVDLSLVEWSKFKSKRGEVSLIYDGEIGKLFLVDRKKQACKTMPLELTQTQIDAMINVRYKQGLVKQKKYSGNFDATVTEVIPVLNWRGEPVIQKIGPWTAKKFKLICKVKGEFHKKRISLDPSLKKIETFEDYFQYTLHRRKHMSRQQSITLSPQQAKKYEKKVEAYI